MRRGIAAERPLAQAIFGLSLGLFGFAVGSLGFQAVMDQLQPLGTDADHTARSGLAGLAYSLGSGIALGGLGVWLCASLLFPRHLLVLHTTSGIRKLVFTRPPSPEETERLLACLSARATDRAGPQ